MIYIWVRATVDWADERAFRAQLRPRFKPKVDVWNQTFSIPYHRFRHRVREIARLNHTRVEGAAIAPWREIPDGALVLPVDDDDWFAPDVGAVLEGEARDGAAGYRWPSSFFEVPINRAHGLGLVRRRVFPGTRPRFVCTTNNYALFKRPGIWSMFDSHVLASRWVEAHPRGRLRSIERRLSAMNRTLASQTSLALGKPTVTRAECLHKLRRYRALYRAPIGPELEWSRPYLAMMAELMDELEVLPSRR